MTKKELKTVALSAFAALVIVLAGFSPAGARLLGILYGDALLVLGTASYASTTTNQGVRISSNTSANGALSSMGLLGAYATRPVNHRKGDFFYDTTKNALAFSTAAFTNSTSGWMYTATDINVWTTY